MALGDEVEGGLLVQGLNCLEFCLLAFAAQALFELGVLAVVVADLVVELVDDEDDVGNAGTYTIIDDVIDGWAVEDGEHLFLNRLGDREKSCAKSSSSNNGGVDSHDEYCSIAQSMMLVRVFSLVGLFEWLSDSHELLGGDETLAVGDFLGKSDYIESSTKLN